MRNQAKPGAGPSRVAGRVISLLAPVLIAAASIAPALAADKTRGTALELLAALPTAPEHPDGYKRTFFVHWVDADQDGCSTRAEVLIVESLTTPQVGDDCSVKGSWRSAYDGVTTSGPSTLDIDHMVPLKEAWDSGAWDWTKARRQSYANDLGDWRSLRAVTATSNRSKGDKDPAEWMPPLASFRCTYAAQWVVVKFRWSLSVDANERAALTTALTGCPVHHLAVATVEFAVPSPSPTPSPGPSPSPSPTASPSPTSSPTPTP